MRLPLRTRLGFVPIAVIAVGCSSGTDPSSPDGTSMGGGTIDPGAAVFVVTLEGGTDSARPLRVDLVGENLVVDGSTETISVDVSVVNRGDGPLFGPLLVWIGDFRPPTVGVLNPDVEVANEASPGGPPVLPYGFEYTGLLGDDGVLDPGEASAAKAWSFRVPGLGAFSFAARVQAGIEPGPHPHIGGFVWHDVNRNGRRDDDEGPGLGGLEVVGPNGSVATGFVQPSGRWSVAVESPGLYRVTCFDPTDGPLGWVATTPNPLEIVLPPDPDGRPQSWDHADFGVALGPHAGMPLPVVMTDRLPDEIPQDRYGLERATLRGDLFVLDVRYGGGCRPEHPLVLHASRGFRGSDPAQTWMLLAHDDLGDPCEALIRRTVAFDLAPLRRAYVDAYGEPGVVILHFLDFAGNRRSFEFGP